MNTKLNKVNCQPQAKAKAHSMPGRLYIQTKMRKASAANKPLLCPI